MSSSDSDTPIERLPILVSQLQSTLSELKALTYELTTGRTAPLGPEEYLSLKELTARIPYRPQTMSFLTTFPPLGADFLTSIPPLG